MSRLSRVVRIVLLVGTLVAALIATLAVPPALAVRPAPVVSPAEPEAGTAGDDDQPGRGSPPGSKNREWTPDGGGGNRPSQAGPPVESPRRDRPALRRSAGDRSSIARIELLVRRIAGVATRP